MSRGKPKVISDAGRRGTRQIAFLRMISLFGTAVAIICIGNLVDSYFRAQQIDNKYFYSALFATILASIFSALEVKKGVREARREEKRIRYSLLKSLYSAPQMAIREESAYGPAQLVTLLTDHVERTTEFRQNYWGATQAALLAPFLVAFYIAFAIDWLIGGLLFLALPVVPLLTGGFMMLYRERSRQSRARRAQLAGRYLDAIRNLVPIRLLGAGKRIENDLRKLGEENRVSIMKMLAGNQVVIIILDGAVSLLLISMSIAVALLRLEADIVTIGGALTVVLLLMLVLEPIAQVAGFFYVGMGGLAAQKSLSQYLQAHPLSKNRTVATGTVGTLNMLGADISSEVASAAALISLRNVEHSYAGNEVLRDINLEVEAGSVVAIVGASGCGKSTLISLLSGQIPLQSGYLRVGKAEGGNAHITELRHASATVLQRSWLFSGTIADNLYFAAPDATEAELWEALAAANIAAEIKRMPAGLATEVGEGGLLISGGQRQRISLARAILSKRDILFFDEATAHVDYASENLIVDAIAKLAAQKTILLITHRHSLLRIADHIYRMEAGILREITPTEAGVAVEAGVAAEEGDA